MPGLNHTGPKGEGPMTGRGMGKCPARIATASETTDTMTPPENVTDDGDHSNHIPAETAEIMESNHPQFIPGRGRGQRAGAGRGPGRCAEFGGRGRGGRGRGPGGGGGRGRGR